MSDIRDVAAQSLIGSMPGTPPLPTPYAPYPTQATWRTRDLLDGASGDDRTRLGEYLATNGNIHASASPLSEQDAAANLAQMFGRTDESSDENSSDDDTLFMPDRGVNPLSQYGSQVSSLPYGAAYPYAASAHANSYPYARAAANPYAVAAAPAAPATPPETRAAVKSAALEYRSDGTLQGKANDSDVTGTLPADAKNLVNANRDIPGGFQIGNTMSGDNTTRFDATIDGKKIVIDQNGDGPIKVTVDGKEVKKGEKNGPVDFQDGGPGNCGTVKLGGKNDQTGAKIETSFTKAIVEEQKTGTGMTILKSVMGPFGELIASTQKDYKHIGLSMRIDNVTGPNGKPMSLGGTLAESLT